MKPFTNIQDHGFAMLFAMIVLLAAAPKGYEFWLKMQKNKTDNKVKLEMLKMGSSADEIVRTLLSRRDCDLRTQRA